VIYIVGLILLLTILHNSYKIYYKRQRIKLLEKSQRELQLKELESEQQIMYFKNENLEKDIDSKSRELAVSTMSLIKKNEFLSNIKNVLNALKDSNEVKSVIKLIDKNITSNDDWKLFEEAFNNADKDFLDKIKSKHQELSPNDLRLCAYLRLNLSSKEIAPLLNISHRSVEVKRYRLRKKMNLSRDLNLTSYILEI
jgi:AraC family chitin signaling transcriptional activator